MAMAMAMRMRSRSRRRSVRDDGQQLRGESKPTRKNNI
jgi:hypothetical protein